MVMGQKLHFSKGTESRQYTLDDRERERALKAHNNNDKHEALQAHNDIDKHAAVGTVHLCGRTLLCTSEMWI
jgi:hypothetical protein